MKIPFTKAHGARNDFLLTWADGLPEQGLEEIAVAICDRHSGIGADGWMLIWRGAGDTHASIRLYNSDGSHSEISGNGTRCVAALLVESGIASNEVRIATGAGLKTLRLTGRQGAAFEFEMNMGSPVYRESDVRTALAAGGVTLDVTILNVGNPQCAVFVPDFDLDWRGIGHRIEHHEAFPNRTNVSFVRAVDRHTIDVRFWERGADETMSSGTGSTGAAFASLLRGLVDSPVSVQTPAGTLAFRTTQDIGFLTGPAELIGSGDFYYGT